MLYPKSHCLLLIRFLRKPALRLWNFHMGVLLRSDVGAKRNRIGQKEKLICSAVLTETAEPTGNSGVELSFRWYAEPSHSLINQSLNVNCPQSLTLDKVFLLNWGKLPERTQLRTLSCQQSNSWINEYFGPEMKIWATCHSTACTTFYPWQP